MLSFQEFLICESFKNLFKSDDKEQYKEKVYELLQIAYKSIGGLQGSGFKDPDDMVKTFPMWKLNVKNGKVVFACVYKDKQGRKMCALGAEKTPDQTHLTPDGKKAYCSFIKDEIRLGRSWG